MSILQRLRVIIDGDASGAIKAYDQAERRSGVLGRALGTLTSSIAGTFSSVAKWGSIAGGAIAGLTSAKVIKGGFSRHLNLEDATAKLKGLGHSAESVSQIMSDANEAVLGTSYALDTAATQAATAVAAGVKPGKELERYLTLMGDAATIAGVPLSEMGAILNKTTTSGKAYTSELRQLADRGLPVFTWLAEEYKVSGEALSEMVSKGEVDAATLQRVLEQNIGGAAQSAGDTTRGALANLGSAMSRFGQRLTEGIFPHVRPLFLELQDVFKGLTERLNPLLDALADRLDGVLGPLVDGLSDRFLGLVDAFIEGESPIAILRGVLEDLFDSVTRGEGPLATFIGTVRKVVGNLSPLGDAMKVVADVGKSLWERLKNLWDAIDFGPEKLAGLTPLFTALIAMGPALGDVATAVGDILIDLTTALGDVLPVVGNAARDLGVALGERLAEVLPVLADGLSGIIRGAADLAVELSPLIPKVAELALIFVDFFADLITHEGLLETISAAALDVAGSVGELAVFLGDSLAAILPTVADAVSDLAGVLGENLADILPTVVDVGVPLIELLADLLQGVEPLIPIVGGLAGGLIDLAGGLLANEPLLWAVVAGFGAWAAISGGIKLAGIISDVGQLTTAFIVSSEAAIVSAGETAALGLMYAQDFVADVGQAAAALGTNLVDAVKRAGTEAWKLAETFAVVGADLAKTAAKSVKEAVVAFGTNLVDAVKRAGTEAWKLAETFVVVGADLVKTAAKSVGEAVVAFGTNLYNAVGKAAGAVVDFTKKLALAAVELVKQAAQAVVTGAVMAGTFVANLAKSTGAWIANTAAAAANRGAMVASSIAMGVVRGATAAWTGVQWLLNAALSANPIGLVVAAIAALIAGIVLAWKNSETFRNIVIGAWEAVKVAWDVLWNGIKAGVEAIGDFFVGLWEGVKKVFGFLTDLFFNFHPLGLVIDNIDALVDGFMTAVNAVKDFFVNGFNWILDFIKEWNPISIILRLGDLMGDTLSGIWDSIKDAARWAWEALSDNILTPIWELPGKLWEAGRDMIDGLLQGLKDFAMGPLNFVQDLGTSIVDGFKGFFGIRSPSRVMAQLGSWTVEGLAEGLSDISSVDKAWTRITDALEPPTIGLTPGHAYAGVGSDYNLLTPTRPLAGRDGNGTVNVNVSNVNVSIPAGTSANDAEVIKAQAKKGVAEAIAEASRTARLGLKQRRAF